jgi:hypothetical protein
LSTSISLTTVSISVKLLWLERRILVHTMHILDKVNEFIVTFLMVFSSSCASEYSLETYRIECFPFVQSWPVGMMGDGGWGRVAESGRLTPTRPTKCSPQGTHGSCKRATGSPKEPQGDPGTDRHEKSEKSLKKIENICTKIKFRLFRLFQTFFGPKTL